MESIYCGPAPDPASLLLAWRFDLPALVLCAALTALHVVPGGRVDARFAAGCALLALLFMSPICALSSALFSARAAHHLILVGVVAPLLVAGSTPFAATNRLLFPSVLAFTAIFWLWHIPAVYDGAVVDAVAYWLMQASLLFSSMWMWRCIFEARPEPGRALLALLATVIQMGLLGALLTFARAPLYATHLFVTTPFGFTAVEDQQLAGLIMWVPGAIPYLIAALFLVARFVSPAPDKARQR